MFKLSKYNCFIPYNDKIIYFNTLTKACFTMTYYEHNRIQKKIVDPISFSLEYPSIFKMFYSWGFFVDSEIEEFSIVRYKYFEELFSSTYHITITNFSNCEITGEFIELLKIHLNYISHNLPIRSICLEWNGLKILDYFDKYIHPVSQYAQEICDKRKLALVNQIEIQCSNNEKLHDKLYNNRGKSTYNYTLEHLHKIINNFDFRIKLQVKALSDKETDIMAFLSQFSNTGRIYLAWEKYSKLPDIGKLPINEINSVKNMTQKIIQLNFGIWLENTLPRVHYLNVCPSGDISMIPFKRTLFSNIANEKNILVGQLTTDGKIKWDKNKRERILSQSWYENQTCKSCKYLPLLMDICIQCKIRQNSILCPLKNDLIDVNSIITTLFENKKV